VIAAASYATRPLRIGLWAAVIVALGVAVAVPDQIQDAVVGVAAGAALIGALIQPLVVLPLLLFAVPFGGLTRSSSADAATTDLSFGAAELLVALLTLTWLARGVRRREIDVRVGAVALAALAMAGLAAFSIGYAVDRASAIKESLKWLELLLALIILVDVVKDARAARWVIGAMFVAGTAESVYGAVQFLTGSGPSFFELQGALRAFGHFDQPNPFAGYLTIILPLAVCMALCRANPVPFRFLSLGAAGLMAMGIGLSQSRGAWLGAGVAGVCLLLAWSRFTRRLLIPCAAGGVLVLGLALSGLLPASILDRLAQTVEYFGVFDVRTVEVTSENWAIVERMAHWQAGWYMFVNHPWLGVGAGNYPAAYPDYFVASWREALGHAHNYYLNILAELGIIGGSVLLFFVGAAFIRLGGALVRSEKDPSGGSRGLRPLENPPPTSPRGGAQLSAEQARPYGGSIELGPLENPPPTSPRGGAQLSAEQARPYGGSRGLRPLEDSPVGSARATAMRPNAEFWRAVLAGAFGGLVVFCVHNLFDSLFVHSVNVQVGVLLGLGLVAAERVTRQQQPAMAVSE
jgi:putative inorganic carbon (hco3(-)) transporter